MKAKENFCQISTGAYKLRIYSLKYNLISTCSRRTRMMVQDLGEFKVFFVLYIKSKI